MLLVSNNSMIKSEVYQRLSSSVDRIQKFISRNQNAPFLLQVVDLSKVPTSRPRIGDSEVAHRQRCLQEFQRLPRFQTTSPCSYNELLRNLYPGQNGLSQLKPVPFAGSYVNHSSLYRCYMSLPSPGVGHLQPTNFEEFMRQMFDNRVFAKPNVLASSVSDYYDEKYLLRQYYEALYYRKSHLRKLWQIAKDMDAAKIPLSDYERRQMVFMTFYKDRPDIARYVLALLSNSKETLRKNPSEDESPVFDWATYKEFSSLDTMSPGDIEYKNTLLFCAVRHSNWLAEQDILQQIGRENFTRDTYKILLDNHASHGRLYSFVPFLDLLSSSHMHLLDIRLLNIIIRSLVGLGFPNLSKMLLSAFLQNDAELLSSSDCFLKQLTYSDRTKYSAYLHTYDQSYHGTPVRLFATEQTFRPVVEHYCAVGSNFTDIMRVFFAIEVGWGLPLSSQAFKNVFHAFTTAQYSTEDLQLITMKLTENHDRYYNLDSWVNEKTSQTSIPPNASKILLEVLNNDSPKHHGTDEGAFLKLSNALMRLVFKAYNTTYKNNPEKRAAIGQIETQIWRQLENAKARLPPRFSDRLVPADLYGREELAYIKKTGLLQLLDI